MPLTCLRFVAATWLGLGLALGSISCGENGPPKSDHNTNAVLPDDMKTLTQSQAAAQPVIRTSSGVIVEPQTPAPKPQVAHILPAPKPAIPKEDIVVPPPDARWTLFVASFDGPGHVELARSAREQLKVATSSNKFYVIHEEARSVVYYGFYRDINSGVKDGKQAQGDKDYLKGLRTSSGETPLAMIHFEPINGTAPDAPADWDMGKIARGPDHYWSLQIAAYTSDARGENPGEVMDRKAAAVESVRALRANGVEAYFYHGPSISSVCVGIWPENAVKRQDGGNARGNAQTISPNDRLLVADASLPSNVTIDKVQGQKVKALTPRLEVLDPGMMAMMRKFPTHALNGYDMMRTSGKGKDSQAVPDPSVLVLVPERTSAAPTNFQSDADLLRLQLQPLSNTPSQPGAGRLKSVDE